MEGEASAFRLAQLETLVKGYQVEKEEAEKLFNRVVEHNNNVVETMKRVGKALKWTLTLLQMQRRSSRTCDTVFEITAFHQDKSAEEIIEEAKAVLKLLSLHTE